MRLPGTISRGTASAAWGSRFPDRFSSAACSTSLRTCRRGFCGVRRSHCMPVPWRSGQGFAVPLVVRNDGNMGGVAEAQRVRGHSASAVLMLAPGSGLGCAYRSPRIAARRGHACRYGRRSHAAPLHCSTRNHAPCGCGRTWGCVEVYTTLSGLPHLLAEPAHGDSIAPEELKQRLSGLRGSPREGDPLACEIFDFRRASSVLRRDASP